MKTVIRNSYTPKIGDYCETIVVDKESESAYIFDCDGVFTEVPQPVDVKKILEEAAAYTDEQVAPLAEKLDTIEEGAQVNVIEHVLKNGTELTITNKTVNVTVPTKTSDLTNDGSDGTDTYVESSTLDDYYTKAETDTQIGYETDAREIADSGLQEQIDAIVASSDVVDIVGTYAALQAYDTSKLGDNDIIKVLTDETRDDATTYYRWDADTSTWGYIGAEGPFYTKAESDAIFTPMTRTVNGKALTTDITLTAADVHALPDSTVIPTVNDATLTIQQNGTTVQTFTANQATNATANIIVPTDTSDLTNDGDGQSPFATEDYVDTYGGKIDTIEVNGTAQPIVNKTVDITVPTKTSELTNDGADGTSTYVEADNLGAAAFSNQYADLDGLPTIPTVNDATLTIQKNGTDVAAFTANSASAVTANITVPTDTSDLTNGAGFITTAALSNYYTKGETYSQQEVNSLINTLSIPTKTSDLTNDGVDGTSTYVEASALGDTAFSNDYNDLDNLPTIPSYSDFTGATSSTAGAHGLVPAPAAGDEGKFLQGDGTWATVQSGSAYTAGNGIDIDANNEISVDTTVVATQTDLSGKQDTLTPGTNITISNNTISASIPIDSALDVSSSNPVENSVVTAALNDKSDKFVIVKYGESNAWAKFIDAYNNNKIVYCRASSNSNPATGAQTRLAFMAYVSAETNPTNVEFQYVRSVSSKTSSQPVDQVFVYKLTNANGGTWTVESRNVAPKIEAGTNTTVSYSNGTYTVSSTGGSNVTKTSDLTNDGEDGVHPFVDSETLSTALSGYQQVLTAGDHIDITGSTISAEDYVHSENPVSVVNPGQTVSGTNITDGSIAFSKVDSSQFLKLQLTTTDPGEGSPLAANTLLGVYE